MTTNATRTSRHVFEYDEDPVASFITAVVSSPIGAQSSRDRVLDDRRIKVVPHVDRALPGSVGLFAIGLKRTALIGHFLRAPAIVENVVTDQIARRVVGVGLDDAELECDVAQIGVTLKKADAGRPALGDFVIGRDAYPVGRVEMIAKLDNALAIEQHRPARPDGFD